MAGGWTEEAVLTTENARTRHGELIGEAARSLNARGVSQTSLAEIAGRLGISRAALYYYVEDRQDLVFQCYRLSCERFADCLEAAGRQAHSEREALRRFIALALDTSEGAFASPSELGCLDAGRRDTVVGLYEAVIAELAGIVGAGIAAGVFRRCEPAIAARTLLSMVFWTPMADSWSASLKAAARRTGAEALTDLVENGLAGPAAPDGPLHRTELRGFLPVSSGAFDKVYLTRARREALLAAASRLFNRKGVDATSLEEIASQAGTTKRAVLHHFGDKQHLVEAAYRRGLELSIYIPERLARTELRPGAKLASAFAAVAEASLNPDLALATPRVGLQALRPEAQREMQQLSDRLAGHYIDLIAEARAADEVRDIDVPGFLITVAGAFQWLSQGVFQAGAQDEFAVASEVSALLMHGLSIRR